MAIGSRLREIRHEHNLTLLDVVEATDLSEPYVSRVERDQVLPNPDTFTRIAQAIDVPDDVLGELLANLLFERDRTEVEKLGFAPEVAQLAAALNRLDPKTRGGIVDAALNEAADHLPMLESLAQRRHHRP